jgi:hypothetical protein
LINRSPQEKALRDGGALGSFLHSDLSIREIVPKITRLFTSDYPVAMRLCDQRLCCLPAPHGAANSVIALQLPETRRFA